MRKDDASVLKAIIRSDFLSFARKAFSSLYPNMQYSPEWFHEIIVSRLAFCNDNPARLIINAPPRSLKSFLVSVVWVAFTLGRDPSRKFICVSYSQQLASSFSTECRRIMESDWYCEAFATRLSKSTEDELVTSQGGCRLARSVGGTLTGLGADIIIVDDPLNAIDAGSDHIRRACNIWFDSSLMSRLNNKATGAILVLMQRLHMEDLTGHLLGKGGWDHVLFPAISSKDQTINLPDRTFTWRTGEPLQSREPLQVLNDVRQQIGFAAFQAQYLQEPAPEAGNDLKREWLRYCEVAPVRQDGDQIVLSCDTAAKAGEGSNYSTCLVFLVRNKNQYYLIDVWRDKVEFHELCIVMKDQIKKHKPNAVLIEDTAMGSSLISELKRYGLQGIVAIKPNKDKRSRMTGETAKLQAGSLILPRAAPWLGDFILEYISFPYGKTDDMIDAMSQFLAWRTDAEGRVPFACDWGDDRPDGSLDHQARLGAPSPTEMFRLLR